jgi:aspartyl-tRNA(Asn)/glutamyl-tRNA(Gln) amidotransferase subunit A
LARRSGNGFSSALTACLQSKSDRNASLVSSADAECHFLLDRRAFDSFYLPSLKLRQLLTESTLALFRHGSPFHASAKPPSERGVDVLLSPTTTTSATPLAGSAAEGYAQDVLSVGANLTGFPALSVSLGPGEDGWPVGVTITGVWGADAVVLRVGKEIERSVKQADAM